jgi:hypothetical protein
MIKNKDTRNLFIYGGIYEKLTGDMLQILKQLYNYEKSSFSIWYTAGGYKNGSVSEGISEISG